MQHGEEEVRNILRHVVHHELMLTSNRMQESIFKQLKTYLNYEQHSSEGFEVKHSSASVFSQTSSMVFSPTSSSSTRHPREPASPRTGLHAIPNAYVEFLLPSDYMGQEIAQLPFEHNEIELGETSRQRSGGKRQTTTSSIVEAERLLSCTPKSLRCYAEEYGPNRHRIARLGWRGFFATFDVARFVNGPFFDYISILLIAINSIWIGVECQYMSTHISKDDSSNFPFINGAFCFIFSCEIVLRLAAERLDFFCGENWKWHFFDCAVISVQIFETALLNLAKVGGFKSAIGIMRVLRILRVLRLSHVMHLVGPLRMLIVATAASMRFLMWTLFLLLVFTYSVGILFTEIVTMRRAQALADGSHSDSMQRLLEMYGSLDRTMLTLYQTVSEGLHWGEAAKPLAEECSGWMNLVFVGFISFSLFALMNVVVGVFVDAAIRTSEIDKRDVVMKEIMQLFQNHDYNQSGGVSEEEFRLFAREPLMQTYLSDVELEPEDGQLLFRIIDNDNSGEIDAEELVHGCMRLHGKANRAQMAIHMFLTRTMDAKVTTLIRTLQQFMGSQFRVDYGKEERGKTEMPRRTSTL